MNIFRKMKSLFRRDTKKKEEFGRTYISHKNSLASSNVSDTVGPESLLNPLNTLSPLSPFSVWETPTSEQPALETETRHTFYGDSQETPSSSDSICSHSSDSYSSTDSSSWGSGDSSSSW